MTGTIDPKDQHKKEIVPPVDVQSQTQDEQSIESQIESLMLMSHKPFTISKLSSILEKKPKDIEDAVQKIIKKYDDAKGGLVLMRDGNKIQFATAPENSEIIKKWKKDEQTRELTRPSLETLTIIAYRGPVSKAEIELIRGINCSLILRNLLIRGLVEMLPGKNDLDTKYQLSFEFMRWLGIKDAKELPEYEKLNKNEFLKDMVSGEQLASVE